MEPQQRRPRPDLGCSAIGWMELRTAGIGTNAELQELHGEQDLVVFIKKGSLRWLGSRVTSGSIVSDYGLDDRAIGVRSPAGAKDFSSNLCVHTGSGAHPASSPMGTGGPFPRGKARPGRDADHSPPSSAEVVNE
jgi:hypothetical protein